MNYKPLYFLFLVCIVLSLIFNVWLLEVKISRQIFLIALFFVTSVYLLKKKDLSVISHKAFAVFLLFFALSSILVEQNNWIIK